MSEKICPFTPLHYRHFTQQAQYSCDGRVAIGDLRCGETIDFKTPEGIYIAYDEKDETGEWCGVAFVLQEAQAAFEAQQLCIEQAEYYIYQDWFGVDSASCVVLFSRLPDFLEVDELDYGAEHWQAYGWVGFTAYGDGGYPVSRIVDTQGLVKGFRVDFVGLDRAGYLRMCSEGLVLFDDEFFAHYF